MTVINMDIHARNIDKRLTRRYPLSYQCLLRLGNHTFSCLTKNISFGGVFLQALRPKFHSALKDQKGEIELEMGKCTLTIPVRIIYVNDLPHINGMGVAFSALTTVQQAIMHCIFEG